MKLDGKVCVVVGAGQTPGETMGNGRATAITFAREGARLLLVDHMQERLAGTLALIEDERHDAEVLIADVTQESECERIAKTAIERFGRIDNLHYNVGKSEGDGGVVELPAANWAELMTLNLTGFFLCSKYVLPHMREQQSGVITAISSMAAVGAHANVTYGASKAAMNSVVKSMAIENAPYGIRVNAIMPGLMDTPMAIERRAREQNVPRETVRAARDRQVPLLKKMGTGWDVANAALFLASADAGYITGICLPVDGGLSARAG